MLGLGADAALGAGAFDAAAGGALVSEPDGFVLVEAPGAAEVSGEPVDGAEVFGDALDSVDADVFGDALDSVDAGVFGDALGVDDDEVLGDVLGEDDVPSLSVGVHPARSAVIRTTGRTTAVIFFKDFIFIISLSRISLSIPEDPAPL